MLKLRITFALLFILLAGGRVVAQPVYYNTSSSTVSLNTLDSVGTNGSPNTTLLTATGVDFNHINRCTSVAVDTLNGRLFLVDGLANAIFSANLNGTSPTLVKGGLTSFPTDLALDVLNQKIYFTTSSTIANNNTVQRMDYTGSNNVTLFTAAGGNGVYRCTAIALDLLHSKIFIADAGTNKIWSMSLTGSGLAALASTTNAVPTGVAVDVTNQLVYFTVGSPVQSSNRIQRVSYGGTGLTTLFTASGGVQRCTALDLDVPHSVIYVSDAGANTLWKIPLGGGSATTVVSGLPATAKKIRWFSGPNTRPAPQVASIQVSGTNVTLIATNGYIGGTYYILTSTNLNTPLAQWLPVVTNVLPATGNFSLTTSNSFSRNTPGRFYILRVQ
ncbi:MAG TPA: hypothetical protein VNN22_10935 [Verrucomicrobiae bacterium]|nr:hypothetical protein [Verrucomicrobiae bacterium]